MRFTIYMLIFGVPPIAAVMTGSLPHILPLCVWQQTGILVFFFANWIAATISPMFGAALLPDTHVTLRVILAVGYGTLASIAYLLGSLYGIATAFD